MKLIRLVCYLVTANVAYEVYKGWKRDQEEGT